MYRFLPVIVLVMLAFVVAELLPGSAPLTQPLLWPFLLLIYGPGALLIRELVRRRKRGWVSILLLGAAYGLIEEGLALQSLFNPALYQAATWGGRLFGINGVYAETVIVVHAIWSVAIPILLTDLLFPGRRATPYLGRFGLIVTGSWYILGVALLAILTHITLAPGYEAPPLLLGLTILSVSVLGVVALVVLPRGTPQPQRQISAPPAWVVLLVTGIGGLCWHALLVLLWRVQPAFAHAPLVLVPMLGAILIAGVMAWLVRHWSAARGWSDRHLLALASGALVSHTLIGDLIFPKTTVDRVGLVVLGLAMTGLLVLFASRVRDRVTAEVNASAESDVDVASAGAVRGSEAS